MNTTIKKGSLWILLFFISSLAVSAQNHSQPENKSLARYVKYKSGMSDAEFTRLYRSMREASFLIGCPVELVLGVFCRETGFGSSELCREANNGFGLKSLRDWSGKVYYKVHKGRNPLTGRWENVKAPFRFFSSLEESVWSFASFLQHARYDFSACSEGDLTCFLEEMQTAGYAEDRNYAQAVKELLNRNYDNLLPARAQKVKYRN